ncbi:MAG: Hsp20/alpha crystallin family protein [Gemmatimonadetes bacterium]|nr:Hsp20/alpha crystallin family protein [Gemmatimonadota bacterium]
MKLTKAGTTMPTVFRPEIERFFDRIFGPRALELPDMKVFETAWAPSVDLTETQKEFIVRLEAPGVHKENLDVSLDDSVLTISGRREFRKAEESEEYIWREREEGNFVRSLRMPKPVEEGKVTATYEDGILTVRLLKSEPTAKTRIAIK